MIRSEKESVMCERILSPSQRDGSSKPGTKCQGTAAGVSSPNGRPDAGCGGFPVELSRIQTGSEFFRHIAPDHWASRPDGDTNRQTHEASRCDAIIAPAQTRDCVPGFHKSSRRDERVFNPGPLLLAVFLSLACTHEPSRLSCSTNSARLRTRRQCRDHLRTGRAGL